MEDIRPRSITPRAARVNAGLTQEEAAKKLHVSKWMVENVEKNPGKLKLEVAWAMSEVYGIPVWAITP